MKTIIDPISYAEFIERLKNEFQQKRLTTALSVTKELSSLYWNIGRMLSEKVLQEKWGTKTIKRISKDMTSSFPGIKSFSVRNLQFMRQFAESYPDGIFESAVSQLPWGHNIILMQKIENPTVRLWYASQALEQGWSRYYLEESIRKRLYERQGKAINNFQVRLPPPQSQMAESILKDPYKFNFLNLEGDYREHELEQGLINHIQKLLIELGEGFAFVGRQYPLEVDGEEYFLDLLFYNLKLRCYFVVELKAAGFKPEYAGKLNFYLSAVDDLLRHKDDQPTLGLLLCKTKKNFTVEYALRDINKPIGVAGYETKLVESLPKKLVGILPSIEELEAELHQPTPNKKRKQALLTRRRS